MQIGTSQIDITPPVGVELCGYLARVQPSIALIDPLYAKGLYIEAEGNALLWVHADLIGFAAEQVAGFRIWARQELGLAPAQVVLSATHTHAGPATIQLNECGKKDPQYLRRLDLLLREAALEARREMRPCRMVTAEARLDVAIDRRGKSSAHTDPLGLAIGFLDENNAFLAVITNYAMHPVALGASNRMISTDFCGPVTAALSEHLPGRPVVLVTNGACGNLNPPRKDVSAESLAAYGCMFADALVPGLLRADAAEPVQIASQLETVHVPIENWDSETINVVARHYIESTWIDERWNAGFAAAIRTWQQSMHEAISGRPSDTVAVGLQVIRLGEICLVAVPAEIFSQFTACLREKTGRRVFTLGYANGCFGYIPHAAAYDEGGYEVETAHFFYNRPRVGMNGLELLCERAAEVVREM